jgi:hypothetical protein
MEAEYIAASSVVDEVVWFRRLLSELQQKQTSPTITYMDNQSAIAAALEGGKESRRKHIDVKHHSIVEPTPDKSPLYLKLNKESCDLHNQ